MALFSITKTIHKLNQPNNNTHTLYQYISNTTDPNNPNVNNLVYCSFQCHLTGIAYNTVSNPMKSTRENATLIVITNNNAHNI